MEQTHDDSLESLLLLLCKYQNTLDHVLKISFSYKSLETFNRNVENQSAITCEDIQNVSPH